MFDLVPFRRRHGELQTKGFEDFGRLWSLMDGFFDNSFGTLVSNYHPIRADIKETENEYTIEAELPGVSKENVRLNIADSTLTITVNQNEEVDEKGANYIRRERRSGTSSRSFYLENIKEDNIRARFDNGILKVTLPKEKPAKPKEKLIDIQ